MLKILKRHKAIVIHTYLRKLRIHTNLNCLGNQERLGKAVQQGLATSIAALAGGLHQASYRMYT